MIKKGVVEGTVKSAAAHNEGDPVGTAAKCMADARKALSSVSSVVESVSRPRQEAEKRKAEGE